MTSLKFLRVIAMGTSLAVLVFAQDAKTLLRDSAKAMGAENIRSFEYSGSGWFFWFGQAANPSSAWPKFPAKSFRRVVDLITNQMVQTVVRTQYENPPHGGGNQPVTGDGAGHADGFLIAYFPKEKIVVEADDFSGGAPIPASPNAYTVDLADGLDQFKLDYESILGLHGRQATKAELLQAMGRKSSGV